MRGAGRVDHHPGYDQFHISQGPRGNIEKSAHPLYQRDGGQTVEQIKTHAYDGGYDGCTGVAQLIDELVNGLIIGNRNLGSHAGSRLHDLITGENTQNRAKAFRTAAQAGANPSVTWELDQSTERLTLTVPIGNAAPELFQDAPAPGTPHTLTLNEDRKHIVLTLSYANLTSARDNVRPQYVGDFCSRAIAQVKHAISAHTHEAPRPGNHVGMGGGRREHHHQGRRKNPRERGYYSSQETPRWRSPLGGGVSGAGGKNRHRRRGSDLVLSPPEDRTPRRRSAESDASFSTGEAGEGLRRRRRSLPTGMPPRLLNAEASRRQLTEIRANMRGNPENSKYLNQPLGELDYRLQQLIEQEKSNVRARAEAEAQTQAEMRALQAVMNG